MDHVVVSAVVDGGVRKSPSLGECSSKILKFPSQFSAVIYTNILYQRSSMVVIRLLISQLPATQGVLFIIAETFKYAGFYHKAGVSIHSKIVLHHGISNYH